MRGWLGDFPEDFTAVTCMFTTHDALGGPVAPLSAFEAADVIIYKNGSATQKTSTNGVTMTSPFDSIVGLHCLVIDTSNDTGDSGFWVAGAVYTLVLSPDSETIDGKTALNVIGQFGLDLTGNLKPTTSGRKLDVSAGGEAGIDWANVGSPTTSVNLSGTTVKTATDVEADTADIQSRLPAALVSGRIDASVGAMANNTMTAAAAAADLTTELQSGLATAASIAALNNLSAAQVNAEVDTALADYDAPTKAELDAAIALVTTKTNSLTFTVAGVLDANIQYVNDVQVNGVGTEANPWSP